MNGGLAPPEKKERKTRVSLFPLNQQTKQRAPQLGVILQGSG